MRGPVIVITVVRDFRLYERLFSNNQNLKSCELNPIDNRTENRGIPTRYNEFWDSYDHSESAWFVFCHEDFEFRESIDELLEACPRDSLYGPVGVTLVNYFGYHKLCFYGMIKECKRDGSGSEWNVGKLVSRWKPVETFDCCCLIAHSSLIAKRHLRFDENLPFDFYVEDFCATARLKYGIVSRIL